MTHMGTGRTIPKTKRQEQADIERQIREFLRRGGKIQRTDIRETKSVDLTFRHYSRAAMEDVR